MSIEFPNFYFEYLPDEPDAIVIVYGSVDGTIQKFKFNNAEELRVYLMARGV